MPGKYEVRKIGEELFDLENDIGETTDVAAGHPDVVRRLLAIAEKAREDLGDSRTQQVGKNVREPGRLADDGATPAGKKKGRGKKQTSAGDQFLPGFD
jgi:hypothetical protein